MADTKPTKKHENELKKVAKADVSPEVKKEMKQTKTKKEEVKEMKQEEKKEVKVEKKETKKVALKDKAVANGFGLKISPKQSKYVCRAIKGKTPEAAIVRLQDAIDEKRAIPMAGLEVAHQKGHGLAGGKFPKNACKAIMEIVKQAAANAVVAGIENPVIAIAKSDRASAPYRRAGRKAKRAHISIEVRDRLKMKEAKK